jgi:hypothetical protein
VFFLFAVIRPLKGGTYRSEALPGASKPRTCLLNCGNHPCDSFLCLVMSYCDCYFDLEAEIGQASANENSFACVSSAAKSFVDWAMILFQNIRSKGFEVQVRAAEKSSASKFCIHPPAVTSRLCFRLSA